MKNLRKKLLAVCFDYRGTLINHTDDQEFVQGMRNLLFLLKNKNIPMALISRFPVEILIKKIGNISEYFNQHIYSGGGKEKLDCIKTFAKSLRIEDLSHIAFIDDKPDNFIPVANNSDVFVIGFEGSGKYPHGKIICKENNIAYATTSDELKTILFKYFF